MVKKPKRTLGKKFLHVYLILYFLTGEDCLSFEQARVCRTLTASQTRACLIFTVMALEFFHLMKRYSDGEKNFIAITVLFSFSLYSSWHTIHSFILIHTVHLYSASSRELLRGAPDSSTAKKSSLHVCLNIFSIGSQGFCEK